MPFKKGEILYVISKDEDQWWTAKNALGHTGQIPVPYVEKVKITKLQTIQSQLYQFLYFSNSSMKKMCVQVLVEILSRTHRNLTTH